MKDEIKEILDNVKKCCDITKDQSFTVYQRQDILAILDYITNLQIIEQQYSAILSENAELENKITNLQEEVNKLTAESTEWESKFYDLQEELKEYKMIFDAFSKRPYAHRYLEEKKKELGNNKIIGLDSEMIYKDYYDLKEENIHLDKVNCQLRKKINKDIYKSRNEKAIELISKEFLCYDNESDEYIQGKRAINILNGGDEE